MKRRILVVDDDDATREAAALSLHTMAGWDVVEAYCGAQAIETATRHQPDAILLDVMMPAMDGPAMVAKLRSVRATSHIPIVLLTAKLQAVQDGSVVVPDFEALASALAEARKRVRAGFKALLSS